MQRRKRRKSRPGFDTAGLLGSKPENCAQIPEKQARKSLRMLNAKAGRNGGNRRRRARRRLLQRMLKKLGDEVGSDGVWPARRILSGLGAGGRPPPIRTFW